MSRCLIKSSGHEWILHIFWDQVTWKERKIVDGYNINKKGSSNEDFKKLKSKGTLQKECPSWVLTSNIETKTILKSFKKRQPTFGHASDLLASNFLWEARLSHLLLDGSYIYSLNASRISYQLSEPHWLERRGCSALLDMRRSQVLSEVYD